jgi:hypothetical protein
VITKFAISPGMGNHSVPYARERVEVRRKTWDRNGCGRIAWRIWTIVICNLLVVELLQ